MIRQARLRLAYRGSCRAARPAGIADFHKLDSYGFDSYGLGHACRESWSLDHPSLESCFHLLEHVQMMDPRFALTDEGRALLDEVVVWIVKPFVISEISV